MKRLVVGLFVAALACSMAYGWGWWVHTNDCMLYLDRLADEPLPGPRGDAELLNEYLPYFLVGCYMPDWDKVIFDFPWNFSHQQEFLWLVYEKAVEEMDDDPWKVALATGNLHHTASDIVAQNTACPYFACKAGFGLLDVFPGFYDQPGGENEGFFEAFVDILFGDYGPVANAILEVLLDQETFAELTDFVQRCIDEYAGKPAPLKADPLSTFRYAYELASASDAESKLKLYSLFAADGPKGKLDLPNELDTYELLRTLASPAFQDPAFYQEYFDCFNRLATQIARDMVPGSRWFEAWPVWNAKTFNSGGLQGLAYDMDSLELNCAQLVWDARFTTTGGATITSLDPDAWPNKLVLKLQMINALPDEKEIAVRVRVRSGGFAWQGDPVIAEGSFTIDDGPEDYGVVPPKYFELTFDMPDPLNVYGLYFELYADDGENPWLISLPPAYYTTDGHDPFKAVYQSNLFCDECFPAHPVVVGPVSDLVYGWLSGRVIDRLSKRPVSYATVSYGAKEEVETSRFGYFQIDGLSPSTLELLASSDDHYERSATSEVEAGAGAWVVIELDPIVEVMDEGDYTANNASMFVSFGLLAEFNGLNGYAVGIGTSPDEADIEPFRSVGFDNGLTIAFAEPLADGTTVYAIVRPEVTGTVPTASSSDGITIDASPPIVADIEVIDTSEDDGFSVHFSVEVAEPHSTVSKVEACLGSAPALCDLTPPARIDPQDASLSMEVSPKTVFLSVWAQNGAGLVSEVASEELKSEADEGKKEGGSHEGCGWL